MLTRSFVLIVPVESSERSKSLKVLVTKMTLLLMVSVPGELVPAPGEIPPPVSNLTGEPMTPVPPSLPSSHTPPRMVTGEFGSVPFRTNEPSPISVVPV